MNVIGDLKWDQSKFNAALKEYMKVTSRTVERAVNTKAFYVARAATRFTLKVGKDKIERELGRIIRVEKTSKKGTKYMRKALQLTKSRDSQAPLAAVIINARLGDGKTFRGVSGRGLWGREMRDAIKYLIGVRKRSIAYIASGWLGAIKRLAPYADKIGGADNATDSTVKMLGSFKGTAIPAKQGAGLMVATIINSVLAKHDKHNSLMRHGGRGLQLAFDHEAASMLEYLAKKMKPDTDKANRRLA